MATTPDLKAIEEAGPGAALLARLQAGTENERLQQFPGTTEKRDQFMLVPLLCDQLQDAYAGVWARFKKLELQMNAYNADEFFCELAIQVLCRTMHCIRWTGDDTETPERGQKMFPTADLLRGGLKPAQRDALSSMYQNFTGDVDPDPEDLSVEMFERISELSKKKDAIQLSAIPSRILASFITGMGNQSEN